MTEKTTSKKNKTKDVLSVCFDICDDVAGGLSLMKACKQHKISHVTFRKLRRENQELESLYTHARESCTDALMEEFDEIMEKLKAQKIDPSSARVLLEALKWKLCKFYPKMYGDRMQTQIVDDDGKSINPFEAFYKKVCEQKDYAR